jgi:hypothetical protein
VIVGSLVLILAAAGLFIGGLTMGSNLLLGASIVASLMAALMLYIGVRQSASVRAEKRSAAQDWRDTTAEYDVAAEYEAEEYGDHDRDPGNDRDLRHGADPGQEARRGHAAEGFGAEPAYDREDDFGPQGRREEPRRFDDGRFDDGRFDDLRLLHEENAGTWAETEALPLRPESDPAGRPAVADVARPESPLDQTGYVPPVPADDAPAEATGAFPQVERAAQPVDRTPITVPAAEPPEPTPAGAASAADESPEPGPEEWIGGGLDAEDPKDEPPIQRRPAEVAAQVARMVEDVLVIDGRPRYHVAGCVHLLGRESEPLPVDEAVDLGFSPCSLCEPDTVLASGSATQARR